MSTIEIRERLHKYIDQADDRKVKAIYTMVEEEIVPNDMWDDEAFVDELERRVNEIESGAVRGLTLQEVKTNAAKAIKAAKSK